MFHGRCMIIYVVQSSKDGDRLQADPSFWRCSSRELKIFSERKKCERAAQNSGSVAHEKYSQSFALVLTSIFFFAEFFQLTRATNVIEKEGLLVKKM